VILLPRKPPVAVKWSQRIDAYREATGFPVAMGIGEDGRVFGIWNMGQDYTVKSGYYGGYPAGYLRRVKALFPEKKRVLHLFSGKVDTEAYPGHTVDINPASDPNFLVDAHSLLGVPLADYDLILADPPYSVEDSEHYGTTMISRNKVFKALAPCKPGTHVVWLDQVLPMYRKLEWMTEGSIGMVKSTNHRFRVITFFRRRAHV
jgi:hypothetical protein